MLTQPVLEQLTRLGLTGCRTALEAQAHNPQYAELTFEERLGLLLEVECTRRADNRLQRRLQDAHFPLPATIEDLNFSPQRGHSLASIGTSAPHSEQMNLSTTLCPAASFFSVLRALSNSAILALDRSIHHVNTSSK